MKEMTPYNSFCMARRPLLPAGLSSSERNVQLGKMWNALSQAEKDQYKGAVAPMVASLVDISWLHVHSGLAGFAAREAEDFCVPRRVGL